MIKNAMIGKAKYFIEHKIEIHISSSNGRFYNGHIIKIHEESYLIIDDKVYGETPIFFSEIIGIERFKEKEEDE